MSDFANSFDDYYIDLPDDPDEAFIVFQTRKFEELQNVLRNANINHWNNERNYILAIQAFDEVYDLKILSGITVPSINEDFAEFYTNTQGAIQKAVIKCQLERSRRVRGDKTDIVILNAEERKAIRQLIESIKERLDAISIPEEKRRSLFLKLNGFLSELDQNLTRTQAFRFFALEIARTAGAAAEEVKPLWERVDRVLDWLDKAKKWSESLPPWTERRKIEGPKQKPPQPRELDDEIPF